MKTSIIKAKFKRNSQELKHTFLWEIAPQDLKLKVKDKIDIDEEPLIIFDDKTDNKFWCLTNKRIFISDKFDYIYINDLRKVDILDIKKNPNNKINSIELVLYSDLEISKIIVEKKSWHIIYNILKFIIENYKSYK